jgi:hypothetical protein
MSEHQAFRGAVFGYLYGNDVGGYEREGRFGRRNLQKQSIPKLR